jgi:phosphatidylinositol glycan class K
LNKNSRLLVYFTGHGGDGYIKMQDTDVILDEDLEAIMKESYEKQLYL